jgi:hypothetical protein
MNLRGVSTRSPSLLSDATRAVVSAIAKQPRAFLGVAQPGSVPLLERGSRRFKSYHLDHF